MKKIITILIPFFVLLPMKAQKKQEVRAAWITAVYGLDWPQNRATTPIGIQRQQAELIEILDRLQAANFNTILFQTRTRGDVLYPSRIEPFNSILTGKINGNPGYDPLAFAIEECHKRGMECHAWMVAIPLGNRKHVTRLGNLSVTRKKPNICIPYKREYFLNPGHPETKEYLMSIVREIVKQYDVDGVHFDYLRYPEYAKHRFPDRKEFRQYANGRSLSQWRQDNLTDIVRYIYKGVKELKPWVKVSTSPVGKYQDTERYSSRGWNALHAVHQDVQGWLVEGIQDQIYPMMYFQGDSFYPFALDWQEQSNGRHVVPGLGIYFLDTNEGDWEIEEIERQIHFTREHQLAGQAYYRVKYLMNNTKGIDERLCEKFYQYPALQPQMPWLDNISPTSPTQLAIEKFDNSGCKLQWVASTDNDPHNPPQYVIYASDEYPVDTTNPKNIIAKAIRKTEYIYLPLLPWEEKKHFAVTAIDRYGNESEAIQTSLY